MSATIRIAWGFDEARTVPCLARRCGLAVAKTPNGYSITHAKSGAALVLLRTKRNALAVLSVLAPLANWAHPYRDVRNALAADGVGDFFALLCDDIAGGDRTRGLGAELDDVCAEVAR